MRIRASENPAQAAVLLSTALTVILIGCHRQTADPLPTPPPTPVVVPKHEPPKKDVSLPPAPPIATTPAGKPPVAVENKPPILKPPAAPKKKRTKVAKKAPDPKPVPKPVEEAKAPVEAKPEAPGTQPTPAENQTPAAAQPAAGTPQLQQMLTPAESQSYNKKLDATLERVRQSVASIQSKLLTNEQKEVVTRIRTFIAQAEQAREQDLVSAVNLAERADLLSRDLLERLR